MTTYTDLDMQTALFELENEMDSLGDRILMITVFDRRDPRAMGVDWQIEGREADIPTVTMSDPLYTLYCALEGMADGNEWEQ